jgi:hypothetical protein
MHDTPSFVYLASPQHAIFFIAPKYYFPSQFISSSQNYEVLNYLNLRDERKKKFYFIKHTKEDSQQKLQIQFNTFSPPPESGLT